MKACCKPATFAEHCKIKQVALIIKSRRSAHVKRYLSERRQDIVPKVQANTKYQHTLVIIILLLVVVTI